MTSFQRQLNLYGFNRLTRGPDAGGYYHERFLRSKEFLCNKMIRTKVKGTRFKAASSPDQEPDFYSMPFVQPNGHDHVVSSSSDDSSDANSMSASSEVVSDAQHLEPLSWDTGVTDDQVLDEALEEILFKDGIGDCLELDDFLQEWV